MTDENDEYAKAMAVLNDLAADYLVWVQGDLKRLEEAYALAYDAPLAERDDIIRGTLFRIAHDMKGQGATFDYELVTTIGNHLCRYIESQDSFETPQMEAIETHIKALRRVLDGQMTGDGGAEGQALQRQVEAL